ncbi:unnamed protein product [Schistosoma mattheei]|uniref:Uncharacterized protein n=1 Tax=Schistosoma mattheei TaxID=31246 RepID=A0A183P2P4_9TREM|nr:unnamed protein product [Schistosoma mattheei]
MVLFSHVFLNTQVTNSKLSGKLNRSCSLVQETFKFLAFRLVPGHQFSSKRGEI